MNRQMGQGAVFESHPLLHSMLADAESPSPPLADDAGKAAYFRIRAADSSGERSSANILIDKMYATRGYSTTALPVEETPNLITLIASDRQATIGTLSIGFDIGDGLLADDLFPDEIDALRAAGRKVCEVTKLAMDSVIQSKPVLAALFNVAYLYAHKIKCMDELLIEVNPRHVRYYQAKLGFTAIGPKRLNRRVNAPAVLMSMNLEHTRGQIEALGGRPELADQVRSIYPYSFSPREEAGIIGRLLRTQSDSTQVFDSQADGQHTSPSVDHAGSISAPASLGRRIDAATRAMA